MWYQRARGAQQALPGEGSEVDPSEMVADDGLVHGGEPAESKASVRPNNLVAIDGAIESKRKSVHARLEQLAGLFKAREQAVDERLQAIEPVTKALAELAADLGMRTEDLEKAIERSATRADGFEVAHQHLAERTAELAAATEKMRRENDRRASVIEEWTRKLQESNERLSRQADEHASELSRLDSRDDQLAGEIEIERSRLDRLDPRVDGLENDSARLKSETADLKQEGGAMRIFLNRAAWSAAIVAVLLAGAIGTLGWNQSDNSRQIDGILSDLGVQQQQIGAVEGVVQSLVSEIQQIPAHLDELYQVLASKDAQLQQEVDRVNSEVADIQKKIFVPDEQLSTGSYDLSKVRNDAWLLQQQPGHYTVQVVSVYGKNALANFIGRHRNHLDLTDIAYLHTTIKGRERYMLLQGSYATASDANAAVERMSSTLQKNGPYVREFQGIQERVIFRTAQAAL